MNIVTLMGRLTKDPVQRMANTANGEIETSNFTLAVDRRRKSDKGSNAKGANADFIRCTAFGKTAEFINKYLSQGSKIALDGRIQTGSYTNREGQTVYTTDVIVNNVEFAESKKERDTQNGADFTDIPDNIDEGELPFK